MIDGGAGADRLRGGPGRRRRSSPATRGLDELRCGPGRDLAVIDDGDDVVALRADACELATRAGAPVHSHACSGTPACPARLRLPGVARVVPRRGGDGRAVGHARAEPSPAARRSSRPARRPRRRAYAAARSASSAAAAARR